MATAFASVANGDQTGDTALVLTKPTGLAAGDMMVAFCMRDGDADGFSTPAGWTSLGNTAQATNMSVTTFAKIADSSDASASDFSFSVASTSGDGSAGVIVRVTSASFTSVAANVVENAGTGASITGITPVGQNSILLMFWANTDSSFPVNFSAYAVANSNPSWTERVDADSASPEKYYAMASATFVPASATGNFSVTIDQGTNLIGVLVSVSETVGVTASPAVINLVSSVQAPTVAAGATVTVASPVTIAASVQAPTVSMPTPDWTNADKSATPSWINPDKS